MKKKVLSALLVAALMGTMLAGCGSNNGSGSGKANASISDGGKVLNIYCWNEEFKSRLEDHYPGYTKVDATTGKIGDVTVKFTIVPRDRKSVV